MAKKTDLENSEETMTKYLKDMEQRDKDEISVLNSRVEGLMAANSALVELQVKKLKNWTCRQSESHQTHQTNLVKFASVWWNILTFFYR